MINIPAAKWQTGRYLYFILDCPDIHYTAALLLVLSTIWPLIGRQAYIEDRPHSDHKVLLPPLRSLNMNTLCE